MADHQWCSKPDIQTKTPDYLDKFPRYKFYLARLPSTIGTSIWHHVNVEQTTRYVYVLCFTK